MYQRACIGNERPTPLFDLATKPLVGKKVVPGVTVLERLVSGTRERAEKRLWATLAATPTTEAGRSSAAAGRRACGQAPVRAGPAAPFAARHLRQRVGNALERYESLRAVGGSA